MADDTKQRLISAAGQIFAEKGFAGTGVREVCQLAGANVAAVNYHFGDKQGLYLACLQHAQDCQTALPARGDWPPDMPPADRLREFIRVMLASKLDPERPRWHLELMLREMTRPTEACARLVEDYIRPLADELWSILTPLAPESARRDRHGWMVGFSIVAQVLFYYIQQPMIRLLIGPEEFERLTVDELTDHITRFCLAALGHAPPLGAARECSAAENPS